MPRDPPPVTPFDQEQRYALIGEFLRALRGDGAPLRILDVGGRTAVLRRYLAEDDVVVLADVEASQEEDLVLASGAALPFRDDSFDAVTCADTLEHVPPDLREAFTRECCRVARRVAVIAGPYLHPRVAEAEQRLAEFVRTRLDAPHRYLEEHLTLGLPDRERVEGWCRDAGAHDVRSIGHGNLERWLGLMSIALLLDHDPATRDLAARFHDFYNTSLLPEDRSGRVYRHVVVAVMGEALPPSCEQVFAPRELPAKSGQAVLHALDHLSAFDHARDLFDAERKRLEGEIARRDEDLAGHGASLTEADHLGAQTRAALELARADLAGHRDSLATAYEDLAGHREALIKASTDLAEHRVSLATVMENLGGHTQTLMKVRSDLVGHQESLKTAEEDLEGHRSKLGITLADLEQHRVALANAQAEIEARDEELERVRADARAIEAELLHKTRWRRALRGFLRRR